MVHVGGQYAEVVHELDGSSAGLEVLRLNHRCRTFLGLAGRPEEVHTACWECDMRGMLIRPDGAAGLLDQVRCRNCGAVYEGDRFARLMAHAEQDRRQKKRTEKEAS
jgi:hypothetical protein